MDQSSISNNQSTFEDRLHKISYLRALYGFFALELLIVLAWSTLVLYWDWLGDFVETWWGIAVVTGIISIALMFVALFVPAVRNTPVNFVIYLVFTLCFAYTIGYLCQIDWEHGSQCVYYALCVLTAIAFAFFIYAM